MLELLLHTFDGLLREKVVCHPLNRRVQKFDITEDMRLILQDQFTGEVGALRSEFLQVVALVATNIHEERILTSRFRTFNELLLHGVEASIHPAGPALVVGRHEVIELMPEVRVPRIRVKPLKEVGICVEARCEW